MIKGENLKDAFTDLVKGNIIRDISKETNVKEEVVMKIIDMYIDRSKEITDIASNIS